jgi:outer membrane protein assembly factor BamE
MIDRIHDSEEQAQMQKLPGIIALSAILLLSSGCNYFKVYKRDLPQGNLVTADMVDRLQPGMSRDQVVDVMGRPLLEAPFDANEWDYVFYLDEAYDDVVQRRVTLTFADDRLVDMSSEGDFNRELKLSVPQDAGPPRQGILPADQMAVPEELDSLPRDGETIEEPVDF